LLVGGSGYALLVCQLASPPQQLAQATGPGGGTREEGKQTARTSTKTGTEATAEQEQLQQQLQRSQVSSPRSEIVGNPIAAPRFAQGPMPRRYALTAAPLEIHDHLPALNMGRVPDLPADERSLLARIWGLRVKEPPAAVAVDDAVLLEAMLVASGVKEANARDKYREQFDEVVAKAREAVKDCKDERQSGEQLMKFLHTTVMSKGYECGQTSFAAIFDTNKFNCVSATAMYYLVGTRLGMTFRPISIPGSGVVAGHASLDMVEGDKRIQVEPTNPDGFDWQAKVNRPGVIVLGLVPDRRDGHEVDALGIAAMIYSNRGVACVKKRPPGRLEAVQCYLAALALDPTDEAATKNLMAVLVNWGPALIGEKKFVSAIRVLTFGLAIAPRSEPLHNNHRIAWGAYIEDTLESGNDKDALTLMEEAAKAAPWDREFQSTSHWFVVHGEKRLKEKGWEAGLAVVDRGLEVLSAAEGKKLTEWRSQVFRQWSQSLLDKGEVDASLNALVRAYALDPTDKEIATAIAYHTQQALPILESKSQAAMVQHFVNLRRRFPNLDEVSEAGAGHAARAVEKLAAGGKFAEAVAVVDRYQPLLTNSGHRARVGSIAYDTWARSLANQKEWKAALDKYGEGLKAFPQQERLTNNAIVTVDEWAGPAIGAKNWDEAIRVYRIGLEYFPGNGHLLHNKEYCERMKKE
jgi:tetratricopeptide (TPR) repeat protein